MIVLRTPRDQLGKPFSTLTPTTPLQPVSLAAGEALVGTSNGYMSLVTAAPSFAYRSAFPGIADLAGEQAKSVDPRSVRVGLECQAESLKSAPVVPDLAIITIQRIELAPVLLKRNARKRIIFKCRLESR